MEMKTIERVLAIEDRRRTRSAGGAALAAEDSLKPGKWEFVTEMHRARNLPPLPPGAETAARACRLRPGGSMNITHNGQRRRKNPVPARTAARRRWGRRSRARQ